MAESDYHETAADLAILEKLSGQRLRPRRKMSSKSTECRFTCYGVLPQRLGGRRTELMLDLRFYDGRQHALSYQYLSGIELTDKVELVIHFGDERVKVKGRGLKVVYEALLVHHLGYLCEVDEVQGKCLDDEVVVTSLTIERGREREEREPEPV